MGNEYIRIKGKTLKLLKIKKDTYKRKYGKNNVRSYDDVLAIDLGIKMPYMSIKRGLKRKRGEKDKQTR